MHEFEDLVEASVRCLHASTAQGLDHRSLFKALYAFQAQYDTSHTMGRVTEILVERRFVYPIAIEHHPDHARLGKRLVDDGWILERPGAPYGPKNAATTWVRNGAMYLEAGSKLWKTMAKAGFFPGEASPPEVTIRDAAITVVREAAKQARASLVRDWMLHYFSQEKVVQSDLARELASYARRVGAFGHDPEGNTDEDDDLSSTAPDWYRKAAANLPARTRDEESFVATLSKALPSVRDADVAAVVDAMPRVVAAFLRERGFVHIPGLVEMHAHIDRPAPVEFMNPFTKQPQSFQPLAKPPELRACIDLRLVPLLAKPRGRASRTR